MHMNVLVCVSLYVSYVFFLLMIIYSIGQETHFPLWNGVKFIICLMKRRKWMLTWGNFIRGPSSLSDLIRVCGYSCMCVWVCVCVSVRTHVLPENVQYSSTFHLLTWAELASSEVLVPCVIELVSVDNWYYHYRLCMCMYVSVYTLIFI